MRMCSAQGQQHLHQQQQQQQLQLDAPPKRARIDPAVSGGGDMDELMDIDDFDAFCEEVDKERGSAWVEPPEDVAQQHHQQPLQQQQQQQQADGGMQA